jgi:hypothetical protein
MPENRRPERVSEQSHCHKKLAAGVVHGCSFGVSELRMKIEGGLLPPPVNISEQSPTFEVEKPLHTK